MGTLQKVFLFVAVLLLLTTTPFAVEYQGEDVDGHLYSATAFSYSAGQFYNVNVEFDGDEATIYFHNGGHITVTMDDEEIDDPHDISCFDYNKSTFWDLDIDGLD